MNNPLATKIRTRSVLSFLRIAILHAESIWYDIRHGTDTWRRALLEDTDVAMTVVKNGYHYDPSPVSPIRKVLHNIGISNQDVFVDYGSGKGRLLLIAREFEFKRIVGIEVSEQLCQIATNNILRYRGHRPSDSRIEILQADASDVIIKPDWSVFFFFNPFNETVMARVADRIRASLDQAPRPIHILYYTPLHKNVFANNPALILHDSYHLMGREILHYTAH